MGVEYNHIWEECESRNSIQREEICMGGDNSFYTLCFLCMRSKQRERKRACFWYNHGGEILEKYGEYWGVFGDEN
jgi:hypothetical protein